MVCVLTGHSALLRCPNLWDSSSREREQERLEHIRYKLGTAHSAHVSARRLSILVYSMTGSELHDHDLKREVRVDVLLASCTQEPGRTALLSGYTLHEYVLDYWGTVI